MYSTIHSMISFGVNGEIELNFEFFVNSFKRTHWVCCDPISGVLFKRTLDEWLRFLMGIFWSELWRNPGVSFTKYPLDTLQSELWKNSRVSFMRCPLSTLLSELWKWSRVSFTKYPLGTVLSSFQKYSPCTQWILGGQIVSEPTMNPPCTHWVNDPLPPV